MSDELRLEARLAAHDFDGTTARDQERKGYSGTFTREVNSDPFLPLAAAASTTHRIELGTAVAIAFARSPMTLAYTAHQLQTLTRGRFVLGLGTQVRAHVERRFAMPWGAPVGRMREYLEALRAIWRSWRTGEPLAHHGRYYSHTLMTPAFRPPPHEHPDPPVLVAAVGPAMTKLAATAADGMLTHPIADAAFLRTVTVPALEAALCDHGRSRKTFRLAGSVLVATGRNERELVAATEALRARIAFYGSTPAYRPVFAHHGWGDLADRLYALSVTRDPGRWAAMAALVPDEVVRTIGVVAEPAALVRLVTERYAGVLDRICLVPADGSRVIDEVMTAADQLCPR